MCVCVCPCALLFAPIEWAPYLLIDSWQTVDRLNSHWAPRIEDTHTHHLKRNAISLLLSSLAIAYCFIIIIWLNHYTHSSSAMDRGWSRRSSTCLITKHLSLSLFQSLSLSHSLHCCIMKQHQSWPNTIHTFKDRNDATFERFLPPFVIILVLLLFFPTFPQRRFA